MEHVLERHYEATLTVVSLLHAIRAYTLITDSGEYVERPAHVVVSSGGIYSGASAAVSPMPSANRRIPERAASAIRVVAARATRAKRATPAAPVHRFQKSGSTSVSNRRS